MKTEGKVILTELFRGSSYTFTKIGNFKAKQERFKENFKEIRSKYEKNSKRHRVSTCFIESKK